jgi:hypothetical protein
MFPIRSTLRVLLAGALCAALAPAQSIQWAVSLDGALTEARAKGTIVLIAIQMPGERGSDAMLATHYKDPQIAALSRETVNLLVEVGPGRVPEDDRRIRERYLKVDADALVAVPHHLWVKPGAEGEPGELLSSVAYQTTVGQLEWAWVDAIRKFRPDFAWREDDRIRAPESLLYGEAEKDGLPPPPSQQEVREAIRKLRAGGRDPRQTFEAYRVVLSSAEREAIQFGRTEMRSLSAFLKRPAMRLVADVSPPEWHELAEEYLGDNDPRVREEAARALEKLAVEKSLRELRKLLPKEDDEETKGRMLRALGTCGPTDKNVFRELEKVLKKDRSPALRIQATMAVGALEDREVVGRMLALAFADDDPKVRSAAAYVVAARRDPDLAALLEKAGEGEADTEVSGWVATAQEVLKGGDLRKFRPFVEKVAGDRKPGDGARQFSLKLDDWIERMRGGRRGEGEGEGAGEGEKKGEGGKRGR